MNASRARRLRGVHHSSMMRAHAVLLGLLLAAPLAGCAPPVDREKLAKEVVSKDPEFGDVLEKHRELSNRMQTFQRELELRRSTVEKNIAQLRKDLADTAASVRVKTDEVKRRMEPDRRRLELALSLAGEELKAKRAQRASLGRQIAQLKKSSGGTDGGKLDELLREAQRLDQELASLKGHIRLLKIKLLLIKL
ncbi:MAG: hypothetical protein HY598_00560 [Candidatus Omnitrophica bacterium]|nr:hypothetical protein [Candidatus Omnitrophota bacterium]